jgi:signal peptidase I
VRGDVVIATSPTNAGQTVCKRIRAVAGDTVLLPPALAYYGRLNGWNSGDRGDPVQAAARSPGGSSGPDGGSGGLSGRSPPLLPPPRRRVPPLAANAVVVPPGHVWLEGDNAVNSTDSRYYGPVPAALVKGRVVVRCVDSCLLRVVG